jgi:hypothetical protein
VLLPTTDLGRWSLVCLAGFAAFLGAFAALVASGQRGGEGFFDNLWLTAPFLIAFAGAVGALALGTAALIGRGDRSIAVIVSTGIGLLVTAFGVLEIVFLH